MKIPGATRVMTAPRTNAWTAVLFATVFSVAGCNRDVYVIADAAMPANDLSGVVDLSVGDQGGPDLACAPEVQSCSGLCGPVRDNCTGVTFQCGACAAGTVCDLSLHTCITPKDDCVALGRVCGTTKNSCGQTISCTPFTCADSAQECDPDTNQCVSCTQVTCDDLGYQCGNVWLGCGSPSNTTDCGTCTTGQTCNDAFHLCEPTNGGTCGGMTNAQMCDAAATSDGLQCGVITNGCGGLIDCSTVTDPVTSTMKYVCRTGLTCGGAGVPNKCAPAEPPLECTVAGYNCGTLPSACGGTVDCGTCDATQNLVCNLAMGQTAGTCGLACNMPQLNCNSPDYAGKCGKQLDDNCWPKFDCDCANSQVCSTSVPGMTGTCGNAEMCSAYTDDKVGSKCSTGNTTAFPDGTGGPGLTCDCLNKGNTPGVSEVCVGSDSTHSGTCCLRSACTGNNAHVTDVCTGDILYCCGPTQVEFPSGTCCSPNAHTCPNDNKYHVLTDNCGQQYTCNCPGGFNNPVPATDGAACCTQPPACAAGQCSGSTVSANCAYDMRSCAASCGNLSVCMGNGQCCVPSAVCPTDANGTIYYNGNFNNGCKMISCGCPGGTDIPRNAGGTAVSGAHCCAKPAACGTDCSGAEKDAVCLAADISGLGVSNSGTQKVICNSCGSGLCCDSSMMCITANTPSCPANSCAPVFDACGNSTTCSCAPGKNCVSGTSCQCPSLPTCNGACPCNTGDHCNSGTCCTPKTCADLPSGAACGTVADACTNSNIQCPCANLATAPNTQCVSNQCTCTPIHCCKDTGGVEPCIQPGAYSPSLGYPDHNDGCGNSGTCSS